MMLPRLERFVVNDKQGCFLVCIYAQRFEWYSGVGNSFTGARLGNFYIGDQIVASLEDAHSAEPFKSGWQEPCEMTISP